MLGSNLPKSAAAVAADVGGDVPASVSHRDSNGLLLRRDPELRAQRGFSCAFDEALTMKRVKVQEENVGKRPGKGRRSTATSCCCYSFILPDLSAHPLEFRAFLEKELLDTSALVNLEQAGCLNWWYDIGLANRLWPLVTSGDGNCLLHAISLCMLGFHDRQLVFRSALHNYLLAHSSAVYRRWRWQTGAELGSSTGLQLSEQEWQAEWKGLLQLARAAPKQQQQQQQQQQNTYDSLEEIHVFVAANVFRRPIVVVADAFVKDMYGEDLAPIPFGGLYLPLLEKPELCSKDPLLLAYDAAHFSALVPMETAAALPGSALPYAVPLCSSSMAPLPIHFSVDPGPQWKWTRDGPADWRRKKLVPGASDAGRARLLGAYLRCSALPLPATCSSPSTPDAARKAASLCRSHSGRAAVNVVDIADIADSDKSGSGDAAGADTARRAATLDRKPRQQVATVTDRMETLSRTFGRQLRKAVQRRGLQRSQRPVCWETLLGAADCGILCAHLGVTSRPPHFTDVVTSYLVSARARFQQLDLMQKRRSAEILRLVEDPQRSLTQCVGANCDMFAREDTNFLCSRCYRSQQLLQSELCGSN